MTALALDRAPSFAARRPVILGFLTLVVLVGGAVGWGAFATIAGAVIAAGKVEVESRDQVVEHLDGGTVGEILVREGDKVEAGQVLIRLSGERLHSEAVQLGAEHAELVARRNRLEAEFRDADAVTWDAALAGRAATDPSVAGVLDGQARLFAARRESRAGHAAQLRERIGQTRKQIAGLEAQAAAVARQTGFMARELKAQRSLFEEGLSELHSLLELEREAARLDGQAGDIAARIAGARGRIAEIEIQILQLGATRIEEAEEQAREVQARENQIAEGLSEVRRRLGSMDVRAPVAGEVLGMQVFTVGEVVRPGEAILQIVPEKAGLVVRAQLEPIHVDQVWPGQDAVLRFSAFPARTTPEFHGRVIRMSADAQHDQRTGLSWYEVELGMGTAIEADPETGIASWPGRAARTVAGWLPSSARDWMKENAPDWIWEPPEVRPAASGDVGSATATPAHARDLALAPGMPVEVHIRTGDRAAADLPREAAHRLLLAVAEGGVKRAMARFPDSSRTGARATARNRGRRRGPASRRSCARAFVIAAISLAALAGCAVQPEPLTPAQTALRVETDLARLAAGQPLLDGPLTLHGAMARAILHNPDVRVQAMEESLALRQVDQARLGLLPALTGRYGAETRSNAQASSSRSAETGRESLTASTSTDRTRRSGSLAAVWQMLDFGVSYYGAKQQSDRALIVHETPAQGGARGGRGGASRLVAGGCGGAGACAARAVAGPGSHGTRG